MAVKNPNSLGVIVVPGPAGQSIQGPKGDPSTVPGPPGAPGINGTDGRDGTGVSIKGSFSIFSDLPALAGPGDTYIASEDDTASSKGFVAGDGLTWSGAGNDLGPGGNYHNVGPVRGPPGATTVNGLEDATPGFKSLNVDDPSAPGNPIGDKLADKLSKTGGAVSGSFSLDALSGAVSFNSGYFVANSRGIYGVKDDWLGNGAGGSANSYAYGSFAAVLALSPIGDVGITGATRTDQITAPGRLPIGVVGWAFNFKKDDPGTPVEERQTAWGGYYEARRCTGAGQVHAVEINITDLSDGTESVVPSAMGSGPNAVYAAPATAVNIASGGNVTKRRLPDGTIVQQQFGWNGTQNIEQATTAGAALVIYNNGAAFQKGIIVAENALAGVDGTGGAKTGTAFETCRGADIAWIDGTTRQAARIRSDVSQNGPVLTFTFSDFGFLINGGGANTFQVISKQSDVIGVQLIGGTLNQSARLVAVGHSSASLSLECGPSGGVFMPNLKNAANDAAAAAAGVPLGAIYRNGSVLMIRMA